MDMASRIAATSDIVFKNLFGTKASTPLLLAFINAVQKHAGDKEFVSMEIVNPINERQFLDAKLSIIDVRAQAQDGTLVNVEVQVRSQADFQERSLYYWAKTYSDQLLEGHEYGVLSPVLSVSLVNFCMFPDSVPFHSVFQLTERTHPELGLTEDCRLHFLELPKLRPEDGSELAQWLYVLKTLDQKDDEKMEYLLKRNETLGELAKRYERFGADQEARRAYVAREMFLHDQASYVGQARREGLAEGREEGRRVGLEEGREVGREAGRQEGREEGERLGRLKVARLLVTHGMGVQQVVELTGFSALELTQE